MTTQPIADPDRIQESRRQRASVGRLEWMLKCGRALNHHGNTADLRHRWSISSKDAARCLRLYRAEERGLLASDHPLTLEEAEAIVSGSRSADDHSPVPGAANGDMDLVETTGLIQQLAARHDGLLLATLRLRNDGAREVRVLYPKAPGVAIDLMAKLSAAIKHNDE